MSFTWTLWCACLIFSSRSLLGDEHQSEGGEGQTSSNESNDDPLKLVDIPLHRPKSDSAIKLMDLIPGKESTSVQDHFGEELISTVQKTLTNLITSPQTISFLLTSLVTFPPTAIIGSFVIVVLSILQNPTILNFLQNFLPSLKFLTENPKGIVIPKYLKDFSNVDTDRFDFLKEGAKYGTKLVDIASKELHLKDFNSHELNSENKSQVAGSKKKRSLSRADKDDPESLNHLQSRKKRTLNEEEKKDQLGERYPKNDNGRPIPLLELQ